MFKKNKTRVGKRVTKLLQNTDNLIHKFGGKIGKMIAKEWSPCCGVCRINGYFTDSDGNPATTIGDPVELGALLSEFLGEHFIAYVYQSGNFEIIGTEKIREDNRCTPKYFEETYQGFKIGKDGVLSLDLGTLGESEPDFRPYIQTIEALSPYQIFLDSAYIYDFTIDWGDGTVEQITAWDDPRLNHNYTSSGLYQIKIYGICPYFNNGSYTNSSNALQCKSIDQWGEVVWESFEETYNNARDISLLATDAPILTNCTTTSLMFANCRNLKTNNTLNSWDVSNVRNMAGMFGRTPEFWSENIGSWNVSNVEDVSQMFYDSGFNNGGSDSIRNWDLSKVKNANGMFYGDLYFNQPVDGWGMGQCTDMSFMFYGARMFNQDIGSWDVSKVTTMRAMFTGGGGRVKNDPTLIGSQFNNGGSDSIRNWVTSSLENTSNMFQAAEEFNQPLDGWDTRNVTNMASMFEQAWSFNQNLGDWYIPSLTSLPFFRNCGMTPENFSKTLIGWAGWNGSTATKPLQNSRLVSANYHTQNPLTVGVLNYLFSSKSWTVSSLGSNDIVDHDGINEFIFKINPFNSSGNSGVGSFTLRASSAHNINYNIDWGDGNVDIGVTGFQTHTYSLPTTYIIKISGNFRYMSYNGLPEANKILSINNWGQSINFGSMNAWMFRAYKLEIKASDTPNLVLDVDSRMNSAFRECVNMRDPTNNLGKWDVSNVTQYFYAFSTCSSLDPHLINWDTSNVTDMSGMFHNCTVMAKQNAFWKWDVSKVKSMRLMFYRAGRNRLPEGSKWYLAPWDTSSLQDLYFCFYDTIMSGFLDKWDFQNITNLEGFLTATGYDKRLGEFYPDEYFSRLLYTSLLVSISGWTNGAPTKTVPTSIVLSSGASNYQWFQCPETTAARNYLLSQGWTLSDVAIPGQCAPDILGFNRDFRYPSFPWQHPDYDYTNWPN